MALRDQAGFRIVNLAISLGREEQTKRRRAELVDASRQAGFVLDTAKPSIGISRTDDLTLAERRIRAEVERALEEHQPSLVVSPWFGDRHHGHEVVARGVHEALRNRPNPPIWWMWGLWAALPCPSLFVPFDENRLDEITKALEAHAGEVSRNDYRNLIKGRAMANAVLGAELVFGFGEPNRGHLYAELLTELLWRNDSWWLGRPRELVPQSPLETEPTAPADEWINARSTGNCPTADPAR